MNRARFERELLRTWATTNVPLTSANLQLLIDAPRQKVVAWMAELTREGVVDADVDDEGENIWRVRGASRPASGPTTAGEALTLARLGREVDVLGTALAPLVASTVSRPPVVAVGERKSVVASGLLSFFVGPLGWLYAAPLREALPAVLGYLLVCAFLPHWILVYLLSLTSPFFALAGVVYAWQYNRRGARTRVFVRPNVRLVRAKLLGKLAP